ncbi:MAG: hypothetical protein Q7U20_07480 [Caulobacter sp.]|nr:hypothetical protein [Caulobacter sp.]
MRVWAFLAFAASLLAFGPAQAAAPLPERAAYDAAVARFGATDDRTLLAEIQLATALATRDDYKAAVIHLEHFRDVMVARDGENSPEALMVVGALAPAKAYAGDREGALATAAEAYRRALPRGPNDPVVIVVRGGYGTALSLAGRYEDAVPHLTAAYEGMIRLMGPTAVPTRQVGALLVEANQGAGLMSDALTIRRQIAAPPGPRADQAEQLLAAGNQLDLLLDEHRYPEARDLGETLIPRFVASYGPDHTRTLQAKAALSTAYDNLGLWAPSLALRREVYEAYVRLRGPDDLLAFSHGEMLAHYGWKSPDSTERAQSIALMRDIMQRRARVQGPTAPPVLLDLLALANMSLNAAEADGLTPAGKAAYRQAFEDLRAADKRLAADPAQAKSRTALMINMLIGLQDINEGRGEAAYWRMKYSGQVARERSLDRRVASNQASSLAELVQYRHLFLGQIRAGWMWAHQP